MEPEPRRKRKKRKRKGAGKKRREDRARKRKRPRGRMLNDPATRHYIAALDQTSSLGGIRERRYGKGLQTIQMANPFDDPQFVWPKHRLYTSTEFKHLRRDFLWRDWYYYLYESHFDQ